VVGSIRCSVGVLEVRVKEVSAESSWASIVLAGTRSVSVGHDAGIAPKLVRVLASRWECLMRWRAWIEAGDGKIGKEAWVEDGELASICVYTGISCGTGGYMKRNLG
jgi:hypothetical protein